MTDMDAVYHERNCLVAFLTEIYDACIVAATDAEPGFASVVIIDAPTGQMSWHITDEERQTLFARVQDSDAAEWDGHTTEEKYERLEALRRYVRGDEVSVRRDESEG